MLPSTMSNRGSSVTAIANTLAARLCGGVVQHGGETRHGRVAVVALLDRPASRGADSLARVVRSDDGLREPLRRAMRHEQSVLAVPDHVAEWPQRCDHRGGATRH